MTVDEKALEAARKEALATSMSLGAVVSAQEALPINEQALHDAEARRRALTILPEGCASDHEVRAIKNQVAMTPPGQWATYSGSQVMPMLRRLLKRLDYVEALAYEAAKPAPTDTECKTCVGTGLVEDPATSLSLGRGGFKICPDCAGKPAPSAPEAGEEK